MKQASLDLNEIDEELRERYGREFKKCRDILSRKEGLNATDALSEMAKILSVKAYEEKEGDKSRFRTEYFEKNNAIESFEELLKEALSDIPEVSIDDSLRISYDSTIVDIVGILEDFDFQGKSTSGGDVYQTFIESSLRDHFGQFFTPREMGEALVKILDPQPGNTVMDPATGAGGFLLGSLDHVREKYDSEDLELRGIEVDPTIHQLTVLDFYLRELDAENIRLEDALKPYEETEKVPDNYRKNDVVLTNPPFSIKVEDSEILENFDLADGESAETDVLFAEKCIKSLDREDGSLPRFGIVLPEGFLNTGEYERFRKHILDKCNLEAVISMPAGAFIPFGKSQSRTCLLIASLPSEDDNKQLFDDKVLMGEAKKIGYKCGKTDYVPIDENDLEEFVKMAENQEFEEEVVETDNGGRAAWVGTEFLESTRLDPRFYFQKLNSEAAENYVELGEVANITQDRFTPQEEQPEKEFTYFEIPKMRDETGIVDKFQKKEGSEINGRKIRFSGGDLLLSRINPLKKRITIMPPYIEDGVTSSEIYNIEPKNGEEITKFYLYLVLRSERSMRFIRNHVTGSSSSRHRIKDDDLEEMKIPFPDLEKQKEMVEPVKEAFEELWTGYKDFFESHEEAEEELRKL